MKGSQRATRDEYRKERGQGNRERPERIPMRERQTERQTETERETKKRHQK